MRWRPLAAGSAVSGLLLWGFYELAERYAGSEGVVAFDVFLRTAFHSVRAGWLTALMKVVTASGSTPAVAFLAVLMVSGLAAAKRHGDALFSAAIVSVGSVLSTIAKGSFARSRPPAGEALIALPESFSFPSGHTMGSFCLAFAVAYVVIRSTWPLRAKVFVTIAACFYALAVGASRIYLGVHWPSDVAAGWLLGGAIASAATAAWESVRESA